MALQSEKLGYSAEEKLLIVNADDFGMCRSANAAVEKLLLAGDISSATVMMPCPWAKQAAVFCKNNPQLDIGVHLTFTSEWEGYRWGPVSGRDTASSLLDEEKYFPRDCQSFEKQADAEEVHREIYAQIEYAISLGIQPTHLDIHMGSLYGLATGRDFLETVTEACVHYGLPLRLPCRMIEDPSFPEALLPMATARIQLAEERGVRMIDDLVSLPYPLEEGDTYTNVRQQMADLLWNIRPGLTELIIHPAFVTDELEAISPHAAKRGMEAELFQDPLIRQTIQEAGIRIISWRDLMDSQRSS
ncbi:polysaccharide deacetylase family protein [Paenibacillus guangzhouensis]|uniref:polysaccharide deacetylase family protein n=1 Tax=Paenibacillus guangzhouensis TaxID=1473112 RepID=UPI00126707F2|nr:polysaccharide deacetylase family protein [Paenibacillus guangzhouensis]